MDDHEHLATTSCRLDASLATKVQVPTSTHASTSIATRAKPVVGRRRCQNKHRHCRGHVKTIRWIDWKLVDFVFKPLHARFDFTLEGCADGEGLNSHGDLPQCSPNDSVLERDLIGERMFLNPPRNSAEHMARHFENCRRASPTFTMAMFVLRKWAKFNTSLDTENCTKKYMA
jgi:hypothetical protein